MRASRAQTRVVVSQARYLKSGMNSRRRIFSPFMGEG